MERFDLISRRIDHGLCVFDDGITCHRDYCRDCQVWLNRMEYDWQTTCLKCGVDKDAWEVIHGVKHRCVVDADA